MQFIGIINLLVGIYLILDTRFRLISHTQILYFDGHFLGSARYIPLALGILMVVSALGILIFRRSLYIISGYLASFLFIIFYTPTAFFMSSDREEIQFLLGLQILMLLTSIVVLYTNHEKGRFINKKAPRITYEDYKHSMSRLSDMKEKEEI